jgi:hypothetical protein
MKRYLNREMKMMKQEILERIAKAASCVVCDISLKKVKKCRNLCPHRGNGLCLAVAEWREIKKETK